MQFNSASLQGMQALRLTSAQELDDSAIDEYNRKSSDHVWDTIDESGRGWKPTCDGSFMFLAKAAIDNGYLPLTPLHSAQSLRGRQGDTKVPKISGWQKLAEQPPSRDDFRGWLREDQNIGFGYVHNKQLLVFDLDSEDIQRTTAMIDWLLGNIPGPYPMMRMSKLPKIQLYYRAGPFCHQEKTPEIFHNIGQTVLFAIHPNYHIPFSWRYGSPAIRNIMDLPVCTGMDQLKFQRAWGGPMGNGDQEAVLGRGNGSVKALLAFCRDCKIPLQEVDDLVKVIQKSPVGQRHNLAVACVSYARHVMHADTQLIKETIGDAYWKQLADDPQRKRIKQWNDFNRMVGWAEQKVDKGE